MSSFAATTFAELSIAPAEEIAAVIRTKARVARVSSAYCDVPGTDIWVPAPPDTTTAPPPPEVTTNPNPRPPNAVEIPPDFDDTDLCYLFQDLLPTNEPPVYAEEVEPAAVLEPYNETVPLVGVTRTLLSVQERPYALTLPAAEMALVTKAAILLSTVINAEAGALTISGQAATLTRALKLSAAAGEFTATGISSGFLLNQVIGANAGAFSATGQSAGLLYQRLPLAGSFGEFTVSGQDAARFLGKNFVASSGSFTLSGEAAVLAKAYRLDSGAAAFVVDGMSARLSYEDFYASWATQTYGDAWLDLTDWWAD